MEKDKKRFSVRFDLNKQNDMHAYEILSHLPHGERSLYIINAILEKRNEPPLKNTLLYVKDSIEKKIDLIMDKIQNGSIQINTQNNGSTDKDNSIPDDVMDFIKGL
ncbi:MAG: hypothetical protein JXN65_01160 [Clostridia bacterium]|nr:hypothetical protein [Clostridia bacterium]